MEIVVNEWLLDYMCPHADPSKASEAIRFINALVKKCDKIVVGRRSPFVLKFYRHMKNFSWNTDFKKRFSKLNRLLFYNSEKTLILDVEDIRTLPKEVERKVPPSDKYLVELAYSSADRIIVTTDQRLRERLADEPDLKVYLLEEFLQGYLA